MKIIFLFVKPFSFLFKLGDFVFHSRNWREISITLYPRAVLLFTDRQGIRLKVFTWHFSLNFQDALLGEEIRTDHLDPDHIRVTHLIEDSVGGQWKVESGYFLKSRKRSTKVEKVPAWIFSELTEGAKPFSANLGSPPREIIENIIQLRHALDEEMELKK